MTKAGPATLTAGVGGAEVKPQTKGGFSVWYSEAKDASGAAHDEISAFHGVLSALFKERGVIPFRFPTVMQDEKAIEDWAAKHAALIGRELARLDALVQMELHLGAGADTPSASGRAYLEGKRDSLRSLENEAEKACGTVAHLVAEWRQKETREGLRCYALVPRGKEREFRTQLGTIRAGARVTGPWPPSEFLDPALTTLA
jgi:hypothetical protein